MAAPALGPTVKLADATGATRHPRLRWHSAPRDCLHACPHDPTELRLAGTLARQRALAQAVAPLAVWQKRFAQLGVGARCVYFARVPWRSRPRCCLSSRKLSSLPTRIVHAPPSHRQPARREKRFPARIWRAAPRDGPNCHYQLRGRRRPHVPRAGKYIFRQASCALDKPYSHAKNKTVAGPTTSR